MKLTNLIKNSLNLKISNTIIDFEVKGITSNSKEAKEGFIFVAIKGVKADGNKFIKEALKNGAQVVIAGQALEAIPGIREELIFRVENPRKAVAELAREFYKHPSSKMKVVGVTGTNGKTTITYLLEALLKECNKSPAVLGTINYRFKDKIIPSINTTPGPVQLQSMLSDMLQSGVDYLLMEASSHALDQDRTRGIKFHSAIFTNLTQDHLDYHKNFEEYFQAKAKLFKNLDKTSFSIINADDIYGKRLRSLTVGETLTYGIGSSADLKAIDIKFGISKTEFVVTDKNKRLKIKTNLIGMHNVYNILAAVGWALKEGIDSDAIESAMKKFNFVPGRLQKVTPERDFAVFVDYAHTDDALSNVIRSLRQVSNDRIIVVFGCGGERDRTKRPKMGRVVTDLADFAIITNDNPRSEDQLEIIEEIKQGILKDNFCVITDRKEAIKKSLSMAACGDIVLIAGKGHENYQIIKDKVLEFDDYRIAQECLK